MSDSFQQEKPASRINLFLEVAEGDARKRMEVPHRTLVLGDFGNPSEGEVEERAAVAVSGDNFGEVMAMAKPEVAITVPNVLAPEQAELPVQMTFESLNDFEPESIALKVPALARLVATRNLLFDLRNRLITKKEFRRRLEEVVRNEPDINKLNEELAAICGPIEALDTEDA